LDATAFATRAGAAIAGWCDGNLVWTPTSMPSYNTSRRSRSNFSPVTGNGGSSAPSVRTLEAADAATCDDIIASLPDWFGLPEGIRDCARDVRTQSGLVCERHQRVVGFVTYVQRTPTVSEITWMAVHANDRNRGIGTALVEELITRLAATTVRLLLVQTVSDREDPGPEYAATRAFYLARGFSPAAELEGKPENPIQLMSRRI
jgi:ribosomal protein S18 acetylase RimI-like enzyme